MHNKEQNTLIQNIKDPANIKIDYMHSILYFSERNNEGKLYAMPF